MGTIAAVQVRGTSAEAMRWRDDVRARFRDVENRLNAHNPESEIRRIAAAPDAEVLARCSPCDRACYAAAFKLMRLSDGAFNPRWRGPTTLDLGAIAKGFALDLCEVDTKVGEADVLLDLGGNLKCLRGSWTVGVAGDDVTLTLTNGMACATSAEYFRGKHIYDGRTHCVVSNGVKSVTVVHPSSAMLADGLSTTLFVLGRAEGESFLRKHFPEARALWQMAE